MKKEKYSVPDQKRTMREDYPKFWIKLKIDTKWGAFHCFQ